MRLLCPDCITEIGTRPELNDDLSCPYCKGKYKWIQQDNVEFMGENE